MPKYVVFSFDDGRADTYTNAFPVLNKYGFIATVNITTDFINNPHNYKNFKSAGNMAMTWDQILTLQENGWEIASHAHTHTNDSEDIKKSLVELEKHGIGTESIGFASPNSDVDRNAYAKLKENLPAGVVYIRSGLQIRREGLVYAGLTFLNRRLKCKRLFCLLNRKCKIERGFQHLEQPMLSVGISADVTEKELTALINKLKDDECVILMFHSILSAAQSSLKVDSWWWDMNKLEFLCQWLCKQDDVKVITTKQMLTAEG